MIETSEQNYLFRRNMPAMIELVKGTLTAVSKAIPRARIPSAQIIIYYAFVFKKIPKMRTHRVRYEAFRPEKKRAGTQGRSLGVCGALLLVSRLKETAFHASNKSASCSNAEVERSGRQTDPGTPIEALSCSRDSLIDRACGHTLKARIPCAGTFAL